MLCSFIKSTIHRISKSITSSNNTNVSEISSFRYVSNITTENIARSNSIFLHNAQKSITSNETHLTISKPVLNILVGISFNISRKPRFKNLLKLSQNVSKTYISPNINPISKELPDVIHEHNMKGYLYIKKEVDIFGLVFIGNGATISKSSLSNILDSRKTYHFLFKKLLIVKVIFFVRPVRSCSNKCIIIAHYNKVCENILYLARQAFLYNFVRYELLIH